MPRPLRCDSLGALAVVNVDWPLGWPNLAFPGVGRGGSTRGYEWLRQKPSYIGGLVGFHAEVAGAVSVEW